MAMRAGGVEHGSVNGSGGDEAQKSASHFVENALSAANGSREIKGRPLGSIRVREMNLLDDAEIQTYVNFLKDERHAAHFATPPRTVEELREEAKNPRNHFLVATILERESAGEGMLFPEGKIVEKIIGGAKVRDNASPNENDHWIELVVVDPERQGQGLGKRMFLETIEWAFNSRTFDHRTRLKLDIGVILDADEIRGFPGGKVTLTRKERERLGIKDREDKETVEIDVSSGKDAIKNEDQESVWAILTKFLQEKRDSMKMIQLAEFFDFKHKTIFFVEILVPRKTEAQPTARFELTLSYWIQKQKRDRAFRARLNALRQAA